MQHGIIYEAACTFNHGLGANGPVNGVALRDNGKVMLVGAFTTVNGISRNRFARLNTDGGVDPRFDPGTGANNVVNAVALTSPVVNTRLIGVTNSGSFTDILPVDTGAPSGVLTLNVDFFGSPDNLRIYYEGVRLIDTNFSNNRTFVIPFGPGTSSIVTIIIDETGGGSGFQYDGVFLVAPPALQTNVQRVVIGGDFTSINGVNRDRVAQINDDGSLDSTFGLGVGSSVVLGVGLNTNYSLPTLLGKSVVGGNFTGGNNTQIQISGAGSTP